MNTALEAFAGISGWYVLLFAAALIVLDVFIINTEILVWVALAVAVASLGHFVHLSPPWIQLVYAGSFAGSSLAIVLRQRRLSRARAEPAQPARASATNYIPKVGEIGALIPLDLELGSSSYFYGASDRSEIAPKNTGQVQGSPGHADLGVKFKATDGSVWRAQVADGMPVRRGEKAVVVEVSGADLVVKRLSD